MSKVASKILLLIIVFSCFTVFTPKFASATTTIEFQGPYDEDDQTPLTYLNGSLAVCQVTITHDSGTDYFYIANNGSYLYNYTTEELMYFDFLIVDDTGSTIYTWRRQYWLTDEDVGMTQFYIFFSKSQTPITFNVRALGGVSIPEYLKVTKLINGVNTPIAKMPIDINNMATIEVIANQIYQINLEDLTDDSLAYSFGNVDTYTTPITLTVSALNFPNTILHQYKYLRFWVYRSDSNEIIVNYEDTNLQTTSVTYTITNSSGALMYSGLHVVTNSFVDVWSGADSNVTYYIDATVTQSEFGVSTFNQVIQRDGSSTSPIDLSFMGNWPVDATQVFWAFIIFIIFGCFSVLNAYIGGFAGVAATAILSYLGWIQIESGVLVAAFVMVFMSGIIYWKRRG